MAKKGMGCGTAIVLVVGLAFLVSKVPLGETIRTPKLPRPKRTSSPAKRPQPLSGIGASSSNAALRQAAEDKRRADLKTFVAVLKKVGVDSSLIIQCEPHPDVSHKIRIVVANGWHYQPYQIRLQAAQTLWMAWANLHTPQEPDKSRIVLVDRMGNEVGGSRLWGGSLIWVKD